MLDIAFIGWTAGFALLLFGIITMYKSKATDKWWWFASSIMWGVATLLLLGGTV